MKSEQRTTATQRAGGVVALVTLASVLSLALTVPAHAISEGYRKQLEQSGRTQLQDANTGGVIGFTGGQYNMYDVQADATTCKIEKVNGYPPLRTRSTGNEWRTDSRMGATFITSKRAPCRVAVLTNGKRSPLKQQ